MLAAGAIDQATHDAKRAIYSDARRLRGKLSGARRAALGAVLRNLEDVAAGGGLTTSRLPALFETVARNRQWWSNGPLLRHGARVSFAGSRIVWQFYAGEGLQIQWLGTFGKANGLWQGGYDAGLRSLLDETLPLAAERAGGIAWEYLFRFDGGRPPWVSGLAQGTGVQAFARAAVRFGEPRYFEAARAGLGIFRTAPPSGVRLATPAGAHYLIYSFAPGLRVLNGFTQALNGLHDFAVLANDAEGRALFAAGEAQLREELGRYDTGGWSLYALGGRDADVSYHTLARDFLRNLCERLNEDAARAAPPTAPATPAGGTAPVPGAGAGARARSGAVLRRRRALDRVPHDPAGREARLAPRPRRQAGGAEAARLQAVERHPARAPRRAHRRRARRQPRQRRALAALAAAAALGGAPQGDHACAGPHRPPGQRRGDAEAAAGAALSVQTAARMRATTSSGSSALTHSHRNSLSRRRTTRRGPRAREHEVCAIGAQGRHGGGSQTADRTGRPESVSPSLGP